MAPAPANDLTVDPVDLRRPPTADVLAFKKHRTEKTFSRREGFFERSGLKRRNNFLRKLFLLFKSVCFLKALLALFFLTHQPKTVRNI